MHRVVLLTVCLLLFVLLPLPLAAHVQATPVPPTPPPVPTPPATPDVTGTWSVTRTWFRSCPACGFVVIRTTNWRITQQGNELRVDRGLRGTIEGYRISLHGTETDGHDRYYLVYGTLYLSPDGRSFSGPFAGSEIIQNPCDATPLIVTCLVHGGHLYAVRISPAPTASPTATVTPAPSWTPTATPSFTPTVVPAATRTVAPGPTPGGLFRRLLPLALRPMATRSGNGVLCPVPAQWTAELLPPAPP